MSELDFNSFTTNARPLVNEFFDLHRREQAKRNGEMWFQHEELADMSDEIAKWFEFYMEVFRRNATRFRTGHN
ncbi:hypothetical protein AB0F15_00235 [Amycolatopsis sp. NPDC026612]|uniref:hypothetical protein n=1 Tax=Amycolatopsis sp. NPDC026612 TaxID=3155466 RepID=UPI0033D6D334